MDSWWSFGNDLRGFVATGGKRFGAIFDFCNKPETSACQSTAISICLLDSSLVSIDKCQAFDVMIFSCFWQNRKIEVLTPIGPNSLYGYAALEKKRLSESMLPDSLPHRSSK